MDLETPEGPLKPLTEADVRRIIREEIDLAVKRTLIKAARGSVAWYESGFVVGGGRR